MKLSEDIQELLNLFMKHEVEFLLVGGYAVSVHTTPRFTEDIDFFVRCSKRNSRAIYRVMKEFGMTQATAIKEDTFAKPGEFIVMGRKPFRVDILSRIDGVSFDEASKGAPVLSLSGVKVPVITLDALIKNKKAAGRPKDLLDLSALKKAKKYLKVRAEG